MANRAYVLYTKAAEEPSATSVSVFGARRPFQGPAIARLSTAAII